MIFGRTQNNRVSRFVEEIPPDHLERGYVPKGYGFSDRARGEEEKREKPREAHRITPILTPSTTKAAPPQFSNGDMINHKSFGPGMIMSMTPMGGDFLVEIAFDKVGTKRLMLKAASKLMTKQ